MKRRYKRHFGDAGDMPAFPGSDITLDIKRSAQTSFVPVYVRESEQTIQPIIPVEPTVLTAQPVMTVPDRQPVVKTSKAKAKSNMPLLVGAAAIAALVLSNK